MVFRNIKVADWGIVTTALFLLIASFAFAYSGGNDNSELSIKSENDIFVYPLDTTDTISISGPIGETIVEINEGRAKIISSPCLNKSCITMGQVYLPGQWSACLPNGILLYISEGKRKSDVDAVSW